MIFKLLYKFLLNYQIRKDNLIKYGIFSYIKNSSGYVLIIVLIVTTLLVTLSSEFIIVAQTNIGYIRKLDNRLKATFMARSGIELAKYILYIDKQGISVEMLTDKKTDKNIDSYNDLWALNFPEIPIDDDFSLKLKIEDENSKINLSVLTNDSQGINGFSKFYKITENFFRNLNRTEDFADIIIDWVDYDDSRFPFGAETPDYYSNLIPAYSAKNAAMDSIDELLMVKDMTPEIYYGLTEKEGDLEEQLVDHNKGKINIDIDKVMDIVGGSDESEIEQEEIETKITREKSLELTNYFTVYGKRKDLYNEYNKININTASYRVLLALTENMTDDIVVDLINRRLIQPFSNVNDIKEIINDESLSDSVFNYKSFVFKLTSIATFKDTSVKITAYYLRTGSGKNSGRILYWSEE